MILQGVDLKTKAAFENATDCWKGWVDAEKQPITLHTRAFDNRKLDLTHGYYRTELKSLRKGDIVSKTFDPACRKATQ